jgi:hypothetical protein
MLSLLPTNAPVSLTLSTGLALAASVYTQVSPPWLSFKTGDFFEPVDFKAAWLANEAMPLDKSKLS